VSVCVNTTHNNECADNTTCRHQRDSTNPEAPLPRTSAMGVAGTICGCTFPTSGRLAESDGSRRQWCRAIDATTRKAAPRVRATTPQGHGTAWSSRPAQGRQDSNRGTPHVDRVQAPPLQPARHTIWWSLAGIPTTNIRNLFFTRKRRHSFCWQRRKQRRRSLIEIGLGHQPAITTPWLWKPSKRVLETSSFQTARVVCCFPHKAAKTALAMVTSPRLPHAAARSG